MTFSIVARCPLSGALGMAVATSSPVVGSRCVHAMANVGVIAHQATPEPRLARWGMGLLAAGVKAPKVLKELVDGDEDIEYRQIGIVDSHGNVAARTGRANRDWAGHRIGEGLVALGNLLESPHVVDAIAEAYQAGHGLAFEERLLRAIEAGRDVGGQVDGQTSAALLVYDRKAVARVDLRVDLALEPIAELRRLLDWYEPLIPYYQARCDDPRVPRHKDWLRERGIARQFGLPPPHIARARAAGIAPGVPVQPDGDHQDPA